MKAPKLNQKGITHILAPLAFIFIFAAVGGYILTTSHAAAKYVNLIGVISFKGGSAASGAQVTLKHPDGGHSYDTTDAEGDYGFTYLLVGKTYTLSSTKWKNGIKYCGGPRSFVAGFTDNNGKPDKAGKIVNLAMTTANCSG